MKRVNNIIRAIKLTWKCDKKLIFIKVFMMIMNIAFSFTSIYVKKELIDALTVNKSTFGVLLRLLLISTAIDVLQLLINIFKNRYYPKINMLLTYQLQETLIEAVVNVKYSKFDEPEFYDAMEYALTETNGLTKSIDYLL